MECDISHSVNNKDLQFCTMPSPPRLLALLALLMVASSVSQEYYDDAEVISNHEKEADGKRGGGGSPCGPCIKEECISPSNCMAGKGV